MNLEASKVQQKSTSEIEFDTHNHIAFGNHINKITRVILSFLLTA